MHLLSLLQTSDASASRSASCMFSSLARSQLKMQAIARATISDTSSSPSLPSSQITTAAPWTKKSQPSHDIATTKTTAAIAAVSMESFKDEEDEGDDHMIFDEEEGAQGVSLTGTSSSKNAFAPSLLNPVVRKPVVSLWRFAGLSAREYFATETSAAMFGLRHIIHHSRVTFNVSSFPLLPCPVASRYSSPFGSPSPAPPHTARH